MSSDKWSSGTESHEREVNSALRESAEREKIKKSQSIDNSNLCNREDAILVGILGNEDDIKAADNAEHVPYASLSDNELLQNSVKHDSESKEQNGGHNLNKMSSTPERNHRRVKSLCRFELNEYTIKDIRKLHERLASRHPKTFRTRNSFFKDIRKEQRLVLCCLCLVEFTSFCSMSIMAPFFPKEAVLKGMSGTVSGFVFSFYALVIFISSPFLGKIIPYAGAKFLFISGLFLTGSCNFLFGLLGLIKEYWVFTMYCFMVQGLKALGASAYCTASYVFVAEVFPSSIGAVLGLMETFVGLGMSVGPALGGFFYHVGGFGLPFYMLGSVLLLTVPISFILLPSIQVSGNSLRRQSGSFIDIIRQPCVIIISLVVVTTSNVWAFLDPTLEPHLRQFDLTPEKIGFIFLLLSGLYGLSSPLWGFVSDKTNNHWFMMTSGLLFSTLGLLLLGPSPFLSFLKSELWLDLLALAILGVSIALSLLPTFQGLLSSVVDGGYSQNEIATYSLVAGAWSSLYALGEVIGPLLGGLITEKYGFSTCCTVMAAVTFTLALGSIIIFTIKDCLRNRERNQRYGFEDSGCCDSGFANDSDSLITQPLIQPGYHNQLYTEETVGKQVL